VAELLRLMVHSVYSESDIFLRELISNGSDACDRLRYEAIAKPELLAMAQRWRSASVPTQRPVRWRSPIPHRHGSPGVDRQPRHHRQVGHARVHQPARRGKGWHRAHRPVRVGFYSAFMVADRIEVTSRHAGAVDAWVWRSSGGEGYEVAAATKEQAERIPRGTEVTLHLKPTRNAISSRTRSSASCACTGPHFCFQSSCDLRPAMRARSIQRARCGSGPNPRSSRRLHAGYRTIAGAFDEPAMTLHYKAEGRQSYAVLLFAPSARPFDLFDPDRKGRIKLYVRRSTSPTTPISCRPICGSCAASSTARTCRSTSRARCCRTTAGGADPQCGHRPRDF